MMRVFWRVDDSGAETGPPVEQGEPAKPTDDESKDSGGKTT